MPTTPRNITLVQSTPESIWIKWTAPPQTRSSLITKYLMELRHPNGTNTMKNYTIVPLDPILEYTFSNLLPNVGYGIRISAYNAYGKGQRSVLVEYQTVYIGSSKYFSLYFKIIYHILRRTFLWKFFSMLINKMLSFFFRLQLVARFYFPAISFDINQYHRPANKVSALAVC